MRSESPNALLPRGWHDSLSWFQPTGVNVVSRAKTLGYPLHLFGAISMGEGNIQGGNLGYEFQYFVVALEQFYDFT
jgi:hypothetical protein